MTTALIALALFALLMVVIGIVSSRTTNTMDGFLLGGRKMGAWMSAFAYGTTYFSAVIFVGYAGKFGWDIGLAGMWIGVGNALIGCLFAWKILAKRVRNMTHALNAKTMPEFFAERYDCKKMKLFAAVLIFFFLVPYAASVYKGLGSLFSAIFPNAGNLIPGVTSNQLCMLIVAVLTGFYLVLGGYVAIALSDFIQGIIMLGGVAIMVVAVLLNSDVGGLANAFSQLKAINPSLVSITGGGNLNFLMFNILLTSVGTFGLPQMVHKFYAVKDDHAIKRATVVSTLFALVIGCGAYFVGSMGRLILGNKLPEGGYDSVVPELLIKAFGESLPGQILISVILLLVLSASMSTLSSVVLTSSTAITVDFIGVFRPDFKGRGQMRLTRLLCLVSVALSFIFANFNFAIIVSIMSYSWGVVAGCFVGPFIWGLFSKKTTRTGAWCGMFAGLVTIITFVSAGIAQNLSGAGSFYEAFKLASVNSPIYGVCAMAASFIVVPIVSAFTKKPDARLVQRAFAGGAN